jgi:hypothetical protein
MYPPTNTTYTLLQTRHVHSCKHDMYSPTNKTCTLLQTRHVPSYKQDMYPPTNKTCTILQTRHALSYKPLTANRNRTSFYAEIITDITTQNLKRKNIFCLITNRNSYRLSDDPHKNRCAHLCSGWVSNTCSTKDNNRLLSSKIR